MFFLYYTTFDTFVQFASFQIRPNMKTALCNNPKGLGTIMFGFFKSTPPVNDTTFTIDITANGVKINGKKKFSLPVDMKKLSKIFRNPRAVGFETKREDKEFLEAMHGKNTVTNRVNYAWDNLGVYAYTQNGKTASCFGIRVGENVNMYPHMPKVPCRGIVTVNGAPWLPALKRGEDTMVFLRIQVGAYGVIAEYTDDDIDPQQRTEKDFTEIEIQK